jgi:hypothetical protein
LKAEQDRAFARQQDAFREVKRLGEEQHRLYEASQSAWQRRASTKDEMNREFERMQSERDRNNSVWDAYKRVRDDNNSRIESLKHQADDVYRSMVNCFERASEAFKFGDKSAAPGYSAEGKQYQARLNELNNEIRRLGAEVKAARAGADSHAGGSNASSFNGAKVRFESAKREHQSAETAFKEAKRRAEAARAVFEQSKVENKRAQETFKRRLEQVKRENRMRRESDRELMDKANIPFYYSDNCKIRRKPDGTVNFYFGGIGEKDGYGHAHVSMDGNGHVTYDRGAFEAHGAHNFADFEKRVEEQKRRTDSDEGKYRAGVGRDGLLRTNYYFGGVDNPDGKGHGHISIDEYGNQRHIRDAYDPDLENGRKSAVLFDDGKK